MPGASAWCWPALSQVSGTVIFNGAPVPGAKVSLLGIPIAAPRRLCRCGRPLFVPRRLGQVVHHHGVGSAAYTTKGVVSERLNPGESKQVQVALEPTGALSGRVLLESSGKPAVGITGELVVGGKHFFTETITDGTFMFETLPLGDYTLALQDPIGTGLASKNGTLAGVAALGDITLDAAAPVVAQTTPTPSATGVAKNSTVRMVMSEAIAPSTVNATNVTLSDASGPVIGGIVQSDDDTTITFTPLIALKEQTKYSLRVAGLQDRVGHAMKADFVAAFTTADTLAPSTVSIDPAPATAGASIFTPDPDHVQRGDRSRQNSERRQR